MRKYDLLAISLVMFSAILVTAMAIDPKGFSLQAWQPLMAAILALGAGALAFRGATAKVEFDRTVHEAQKRQRQKNLHTKLLYSALIFRADMRKAVSKFKTQFMHSAPIQRTARDLAVSWPPEFDEAWKDIDLLSETSAELLANLKYNYGPFRDAVNDLDRSKNWEISWTIPTEIEGTVKLLKEIETFAADFVSSLESSKPA
jgi:hypothetical protein